MITIPGAAASLCDGPSRRDFLRFGGTGILGLSLPQFLQIQARAAELTAGTVGANRREDRPDGVRQGEERHPGLPPGRAEPHRPVGPQARRPRQRPRRIQADRHQDAGPLLRRAHAEARPGRPTS